MDHIHSADYIDEGQLVAWDRSLPPIELEEQKKEAFELKGEGNALYLHCKASMKTKRLVPNTQQASGSVHSVLLKIGRLIQKDSLS